MSQTLRYAPGVVRSLTCSLFPAHEHPSLQAHHMLMTKTPLHVPEGIYVIRSAHDGRVLEPDHARLRTRKFNAYIYVAPLRAEASPYQLWVIFKRSGKDLEYTIRSLATGAVLDVFCARPEEGTQVIGHSAYSKPWQQWAFYAMRSAASYVPPC